MSRSARRIRDAHFAAAVFWGPVMMPIALLTSLKTSLPFIIAISLYANVTGHLAGWAGASARCATEEQQ